MVLLQKNGAARSGNERSVGAGGPILLPGGGSMVLLLEPPVARWECGRCSFRDATKQAGPHTRFHPCAGLGGLTAPVVPEGQRWKVTSLEREDYIGGEDVQLADGRPAMQTVTERPDGATDVVG